MKPTHRVDAACAARLVLRGFALAACAQAALAAPPALRSEGGLLVLPNVRVENASLPVDGRVPRAAAGMRAYKDHETGQLRKASPEEQQEEAQAAPASNDASGARVTMSADGRKSASLDESFMSYAVVRKGADGRLEQICVTGETAAEHALHAKPTGKEAGHAH
jgi:hypothetical protein